jgi:serine/threonine protein kinase
MSFPRMTQFPGPILFQERYRRIERIGFGGYGEVWRAEDTVYKREVAIKSLRTLSYDSLQRLRAEAEIYMQEQTNPYVLKLLDWNFNVSDPFLVLEFCKWGTLRSWVTRNWYDVAGAVQHTALGLQSIHAKGGFHRDIKPDNLFPTEGDKAGLIIKIGDFGLGRVPFPLMTSWMTCSPRGTPQYMAPELSRGAAVSAKADIYSLGITGIELITGSTDRKAIEKAWLVSNDLKTLLLQMTSEKPDERPEARSVADCMGCILRTYDSNVKVGLGFAAIIGGLWLLSKASK